MLVVGPPPQLSERYRAAGMRGISIVGLAACILDVPFKYASGEPASPFSDLPPSRRDAILPTAEAELPGAFTAVA